VGSFSDQAPYRHICHFDNNSFYAGHRQFGQPLLTANLLFAVFNGKFNMCNVPVLCQVAGLDIASYVCDSRFHRAARKREHVFRSPLVQTGEMEVMARKIGTAEELAKWGKRLITAPLFIIITLIRRCPLFACCCPFFRTLRQPPFPALFDILVCWDS